jgi:glycosyltransferase involved in cell wall biosynthesis
VFIGSVSKDAYTRRFLASLSDAEKEGWSSFSGFLDELDLIKIMDKAHALLHFPQEEAFGLVVAESLARGLKLFASKVGGICDIASGVPEADLFDPEDWAGLSRALSAWLEKPSLSSAQTQNLMKFRYHPNVIAARHIEIYREVLSDSRPS